ncbi:hypothetical protein [Terracoccus luteus]|uniref:Secretion/DNA translocation related CpaE-like protein n=1 Tax=Terracoccus luteus TaxID=53356 RepID=A0A839PPU9_9MICO|nr:hypothetical protein [Terracoccus luteus]MBB2986328.1 hypothetical protein [Terracoccus luteus]MCP2172082.1 hypothetical protein [Terracoccus luteus]
MGHVIAVVPASGGVGASLLAAAVAVRAAAARRSCVAVDLDVVAGRLDVLLGCEEVAGWRWDALADVAGVVEGARLAARLPVAEGVTVLAHPVVCDADGGRDDAVAARAMRPTGRPAGFVGDAGPSHPGEPTVSRPWLDIVPDVVTGLSRSHDVCVLDLPRDPAVLEAVAGLVDALVVVVGADVAGLSAAARSVPRLRSALGDPHALTAAAAGFGASGATPGSVSPSRVADPWSDGPAEAWLVLRSDDRLTVEAEDAVVDHLDLPLVGVLPRDPRAADDLVAGRAPGSRGRGPVVRLADDLLLRLVSMEVAA